MVELGIAHDVKGSELATRRIGCESTMALAARISRDQLTPRLDRQRRGCRRLVGIRRTTIDGFYFACREKATQQQPWHAGTAVSSFGHGDPVFASPPSGEGGFTWL